VIDVRGGALAMCCSAMLLALAVPADAATGGAQPNGPALGPIVPSGGASVKRVEAAGPVMTGAVARMAGATALAPPSAPASVQRAIAEANAIVGKPYVWGGGHRSFRSRGYDCSGAVSYLLHGGGLLDDPLDSSSFMRWGAAGRGRWITVWTNTGHAFVEVAGLRLDTSAAEDPTGRRGPQWRPARRSHAGFRARHPVDL
jgi:hypothetical protein